MKKPESWRRRYIRLLNDHESCDDNDPDDIRALGDLIRDVFIDGATLEDKSGAITGCVIKSITLKGRLFGEEQEAILKANSFSGKLKSGAGLIVGWLAGILSALLVQYIANT